MCLCVSKYFENGINEVYKYATWHHVFHGDKVVRMTVTMFKDKQPPGHAHCHRSLAPPLSTRRRRSLSGPEMYEQWHTCYEAGWHRTLMQLERDEAVSGPSDVITSAFLENPYLVEFARFHTSQLLQPMPAIERALHAVAYASTPNV